MDSYMKMTPAQLAEWEAAVDEEIRRYLEAHMGDEFSYNEPVDSKNESVV